MDRGLISIIICTGNRAPALRQSLFSLDEIKIADTRKVELIIVDNASSDDTSVAVQHFKPRAMNVKYAYELKRGLSNARNAGLAHAQSEFILFTDDAVFSAEEWLERSFTIYDLSAQYNFTAAFWPWF
jgi:glycosyltransferase involved in cell wall biosynthesis